MDSVLRRWVPFTAQGTACTLTYRFRKRANEGTGTFTTFTNVPDLAIVFADGRNTGLPAPVVTELALNHFMSYYNAAEWSPEVGDPKNAVLSALRSMEADSVSGTQFYRDVLFDGQFGRVYGS